MSERNEVALETAMNEANYFRSEEISSKTESYFIGTFIFTGCITLTFKYFNEILLTNGCTTLLRCMILSLSIICIVIQVIILFMVHKDSKYNAIKVKDYQKYPTTKEDIGLAYLETYFEIIENTKKEIKRLRILKTTLIVSGISVIAFTMIGVYI